MDFLAGTWWIWLIVFFVAFPITIVIFFKKMLGMMGSGDFVKDFLSIFLGPFAIAWFIADASFVLSMIGIIAAFVGK